MKEEDISTITKAEDVSSSKEQIGSIPEANPINKRDIGEDPNLINLEIEKQEGIILYVTSKVNEIRHLLGLSGEETDIPSIASNKQKVLSLKEKLKSFLGVSENVKKFLRISLISALLTYGSSGEVFGQQAPEGTAKNPGEDKPGISSTIETPSIASKNESLPINSETIRGYVFSDENERSFLSKKQEDSYFVPNNVKNNKDTTFISPEEIEKFCDEKNIKDISFSHTHPLAVYSGVGYSGEDITKMQSGELKPSPMPPSPLDFQGITQFFGPLKEKNIKMNGEVFDATGVWKYEVSEKNIDLFNKYRELIKKVSEKIGFKVFESLSTEEKKLLRKYGDGIHQDKLIQILKQNPETQALGEKMEEAFKKEIDEVYGQNIEIFKSIYSVYEIGCKISNYNKKEKDPNYEVAQPLDQLINEYEVEAGKLGFEVEYTPYQK